MSEKLSGQALEDVQKGLRMAQPRDPEDLAREAAYLDDLATKPLLSRARGYLKLLGPGYMQSAMTLGAGSTAASLIG